MLEKLHWMEWKSLESCYLVECSRLQALFALVWKLAEWTFQVKCIKYGRYKQRHCKSASLFIGDIRFRRVECAAASMYATTWLNCFLSFSSILGTKMNNNRHKSGGKITHTQHSAFPGKVIRLTITPRILVCGRVKMSHIKPSQQCHTQRLDEQSLRIMARKEDYQIQITMVMINKICCH